MESGLSLRMQKTLKALHVATTAATDPPPSYNPSTAIDLSNAQNQVLRPELLEFLKTVVDDRLTTEVRRFV